MTYRTVLQCLVATALPLTWAWGQATIRVSGTGTGVALMHLLAPQFEKEHPGLKLQVLPSIGSSGGIRAVADGRLEIACSSRTLKPEESSKGLKEWPLARTPFLFVVQKANPVGGLSSEQVLRAHEGSLTAWPSGAPLRLVLRPKSDTAHAQLAGISKAMEAALEKAHATPGAIIAMTDQDCADQLEKTPGSLGPLNLGLLLSERRQLKALSLDGVEPSVDNLARGRYPHFTSILLVSGAGKPSAALERFQRFLSSPGVVKVLRSHGFLPEMPAKGGKG